LVGCLELRSRGFLFILKAWPGVVYFSMSSPALTRWGFFPRYHYSLDVGPYAVDSPWFKLFNTGPQSQPITSQSQFLVATSSPPGQHIVFFISFTLASSVGFRIHSKLPTKTVAIICSRLRVFISHSSLSFQLSMFHQ